MGKMFRSSIQIKLERPSKHEWGGGLGGGRHLIPFETVAGLVRYPAVNDHGQVLEKRE